jgi:hypothetical protein
VYSFHETGEFGGRKNCDVSRSPPPDNYGFLLVHHLIENAGQIFTEAGVRRFTRHKATQSVSHGIPVRKRGGGHIAMSDFRIVAIR